MVENESGLPVLHQVLGCPWCMAQVQTVRCHYDTLCQHTDWHPRYATTTDNNYYYSSCDYQNKSKYH